MSICKKKYIVVSKIENENHSGFCALGHEIHLGRFILLDMLDKNYINTNDVIVTSNIDRFFLYSKIFKNIISYDEYSRNGNIKEENKILVWPFVVSIPTELSDFYIKNFESKIKYPIRNILYNNFTRDYDELLKMIDFPLIEDYNLVKNKFIVIHLRTLLLKSNNNINQNLIDLYKIIYKINITYPDFDIVIFTCNDSNELLKLQENTKIKIINKLDLYASVMNHENCECVITELSGGGEFSQFCCNTTIHMYGNSYNNIGTFSKKLSTLQNGKFLHDDWNKHGTTDALLNYYNNIDAMLENI
jgi:hypothetical protein